MIQIFLSLTMIIKNMTLILNEELRKIKEWTTANRLTINTDKTELLLFSNRQVNSSDTDIIFDEIPVAYRDQARFLGVTIDENLNFKAHIDNVNTKVSRLAGILYRIKNNLTLTARKTFYNSFILPYLSYNVINWGNTNETHLKPLYLTQKRIIRCITKANYLDSTTPLFYNLSILKLQDLYRFYAALDTFEKLKKGHYEITHDRNTRNKQNALPKYHRLSRTQQSITFSGPTIWNTLPDHLRNINSLPNFKHKLKKYLLEQYAPANS